MKGRGSPEFSARTLSWSVFPFPTELIQSGWFAVGSKPSPETEDPKLAIKTSAKICYIFFPPPDLPLKMICREAENMGKQTWLKFPHIKYLCGNGRSEQSPSGKALIHQGGAGGTSSWRRQRQRQNENLALSLCHLGHILAFPFHLFESIFLTLFDTHWRCLKHHGASP